MAERRADVLVAGGGVGGVAAALASTGRGLHVVFGTTHITNGALRLHPVEWNAGETAGHLAAYCAARRVQPRMVCAQPALLAGFQRELDAAGIEPEWPQSRTQRGR